MADLNQNNADLLDKYFPVDSTPAPSAPTPSGTPSALDQSNADLLDKYFPVDPAPTPDRTPPPTRTTPEPPPTEDPSVLLPDTSNSNVPEFKPGDFKVTKESLSEEDVVSDPNLMDIVNRALKARYGRLDPKLTDSQKFEQWQSWNRYFLTNTPTTAHSGVMIAKSRGDRRKAFRDSFALWDSMETLWTGDTWDALGDYVGGVLKDPITYASMGVGKVISQAGGTGVRALATNALRYSALDIGASVTQDAIDQRARIKVGAQKGGVLPRQPCLLSPL